jgi:uncharacterized protein YicC (UPF0701 family)
MRSHPLFVVGAIILALAVPGIAQEHEHDEDFDHAAVARQIRRNMEQIEEALQQLSAPSPERGAAVEKDIQRLIEKMTRRQEQVVKDIDDFVKHLKG